MLRQGKVHWMVIAGILAAVVIGVLVFGGSEDPTMKAQKFMTALADGDAKKLAEYSTSGTYDHDQLEKLWAKSVSDAEYYRFRFKIMGAQLSNSNQAQVRMLVKRSDDPGAVEDNFQLDLKKVDGAWKVRLEGLSRELYPFLPR
ncbi:MAG: DUF4878 domain-containing protein [Fimbriimonadaceae bacterium]|nr:MAG: DUF4878 domain-containing protein [Fimbriimonadaceae bacterium]